MAGTWRPSTSAETAARYLALRYARGKFWGNEPVVVAQERAKLFRDFVLEHVSTYTPRHAGVIYKLVEDDWGLVCRRRVERALRWLVEQGSIVRNDNGYVKARAA